MQDIEDQQVKVLVNKILEFKLDLVITKKGGGSVGLVVGGAELQPAGTKVVVPSSGVSAEGPRTLMEGVRQQHVR